MENLGAALLSLVQDPMLILMMIVGIVIGIVAGALPGLTMVAGMLMVLPFALQMDVGRALLLLFGIYIGGIYGGSITAILFNIPGDPMNVCTALDGYALNKKGRGGFALGLALLSSNLGGFLSAVVVVLAAPLLAAVALKFSAVEFFAILFFGLATVSILGTGSPSKSLLSLCVGLFLGTVGVEGITGTPRFTFGTELLAGGINFVPVLVGMFAVGEVLDMVSSRNHDVVVERDEAMAVSRRARLPNFRECWELKFTWLRSWLIGMFVGFIPAAGATVAAFLGYGLEKQVSRHPEEFGRGRPEGVAAGECANEASTGGAMLSLLSLGIPGSAATAIMLAVFMVKGLEPGPQIFVKMPELVSLVFAGMLVANILKFGIGWLFIKPMVRLMDVPKPVMAALILVLSFFGAFTVRNEILDVWMAMAAGVIGFFMRRFDFPTAPLVLGLILGPLAEDKFMTSMYSHHNDFSVFFTRPVSAVFIIAGIIALLLPVIRSWRQGNGSSTEGENE